MHFIVHVFRGRERWRELPFHRVPKAEAQAMQRASEGGLIGASLAGEFSESTMFGTAVEMRLEKGKRRLFAGCEPLGFDGAKSSTHNVQRPLAIEFTIGRQDLRIGEIESRRSIRGDRERQCLPPAAALRPRRALPTVAEEMFQRPEQIVAESPASGFRAAERRVLQHMGEKLVRQLPRGVLLAAGAPEKRDDRGVIGRAQFTESLSRRGRGFRGAAHQRPARGMKGFVGHGRVEGNFAKRGRVRSAEFHREVVEVHEARRAIRLDGPMID